MKVDGNKIQELREHYEKKAEREILIAKHKNNDISEDDINDIKNKYISESEKSIKKILALSPEKMFKLGFSHDSDGWRSGFTKSTVAKRAEKRHKRNKAARKQKRKNRK